MSSLSVMAPTLHAPRYYKLHTSSGRSISQHLFPCLGSHSVTEYPRSSKTRLISRYFWTARSGRCSRIASMRTRSGPIHVTSTRTPRRTARQTNPLSGHLMNRVSVPSQRVSSNPFECSAETQKDMKDRDLDEMTSVSGPSSPKLRMNT
jgi:hypothetical protein